MPAQPNKMTAAEAVPKWAHPPAEHRRWCTDSMGEAEGLGITVAAGESKLAPMKGYAKPRPVDLGLPVLLPARGSR